VGSIFVSFKGRLSAYIPLQLYRKKTPPRCYTVSQSNGDKSYKPYFEVKQSCPPYNVLRQYIRIPFKSYSFRSSFYLFYKLSD